VSYLVRLPTGLDSDNTKENIQTDEEQFHLRSGLSSIVEFMAQYSRLLYQERDYVLRYVNDPNKGHRQM
jgi:hypothetical protein